MTLLTWWHYNNLTMANEVSPDLTKQIEEYLTKRGKGETETLAFFYKEIFGRELKINCGGCIEDAVQHLKQRIQKPKPPMINYKWIGSDRATVITKAKTITKANCNDADAELISRIPKYAHLVEEIEGAISKVEETVIVFTPKQTAAPIIETQAATTLISTEAKTEERIVKRKYEKRK